MIGIVSGAGPLAGLDVARKIIEETQASKDQEHLPVLLFSMPDKIPDRTDFLLGKIDQNPGISIGKVFVDLEKAGASIAAIACNTAHADPIFDEVRAAVAGGHGNMRVLHLLDETLGWIAVHLPGGQRIGVLSTDGTRQMGLYRDRLEKQGLEVIEPSMERQPAVHGAIYDPVFGIKSQSSPVDPRAVASLEQAMDELIDRGAEAILLGCTELPLALTYRTYRDVMLIDPNRILARRMIGLFAPGSLRSGSFQ